ncbi:hypothetical protein QJS04_geneDACA020549 [Acorus gramineus]|uniref:Protein LOW PSII ACCUMULATION 2, chloroplastic n=1 Tax=Acorus gramineus TaxID=55184 RepID=A0AAV9AD82_ACOGR|nr:hypothetical protein QJS04_geneDACA020549 [Acorus gramineus]
MERASPLATQRRLQIHFSKIPFVFSPFPRHSILLPLRPSHTPRAESERDQNADASSIASDAPPKRPPEGKGLGFGKVTAEVKKRKGKERRSNIVRRSPVEKPTGFFSGEGQPSDRNQEEQQQQPSLNENAFLLTWLGLGALILVEGIALAASGFLPEDWDNFFVKYLYPSFTPTVFLFVGGTTAYGVIKYLQGEKNKN